MTLCQKREFTGPVDEGPADSGASSSVLEVAPVERGNGAMDDAPRQCPYCDLRFSYHNEVKDHILHDHHDHEDVVAAIEPHEMPHL